MKNTILDFSNFQDEARAKALAQHLDLSKQDEIDDIEECSACETYTYADDDYLVITDSEADEKWDEYMDNYIDECVLGEIPESCRSYFDTERFKNDCSYDGRGHILSSYDGEEHCEDVDGETYYIYRKSTT